MSQSIDTTLGKFVDHLTRGFTPELAKHFAEIPEPNPEFQARLDELMRLKARVRVSSSLHS
jgi:hypothetical protein